jgi:xanthine/uracil permease
VEAPAASFIWVHTFPLTVYGPLILPLLAVYIVLAMEAIGDITATCDVSRLQVSGLLFDSRIQGGVLADGFNGMLASRMFTLHIELQKCLTTLKQLPQSHPCRLSLKITVSLP